MKCITEEEVRKILKEVNSIAYYYDKEKHSIRLKNEDHSSSHLKTREMVDIVSKLIELEIEFYVNDHQCICLNTSICRCKEN